MIWRSPSWWSRNVRHRVLLSSAALLLLAQIGAGFPSLDGQSLPAGFGPSPAQAAEKESWLKRHEAQGGHTLARHVGKDEAWLRARLDQDPRLSRASSFPDVATAEKVIIAAGNANRNTIGEWLRNGRVGSRITLDYEGQQKIGISVSRRTPRVFDCFKARIVLQSVKGPDYFVLTAYPD